MASTWGIRLRVVPIVLRELWRSIDAALRGEERRLEAALDFVKENATPGDANSVLAAIDRFARERRWLFNVGDEKGLILDEAVKRVGSDARILELGCHCGYSAIRMARHLNRSGRVTSLEINQKSVQVARDMVRLAGVADRVDICRGKSSELIPTLEEVFDLVFLDHRKSLYGPDLKLIERLELIRPQSVIVADNVGPLFWAKSYLDYVRNSGRYTSRYVRAHLEHRDDIEDGVEISVFQGSGAAA
jgi:catechol O-methyltransferase